jgi:hypothetical protein
VYSFDGEVVFRYKNPNLNNEPRTYSLMPVEDNELMYERRWNGQPVQDTYLSIEHFHGHIVTMFFFYFPIPKSTASELSERFLPMVKEAAKNLPIAHELSSAAEKFLSGKDADADPMYRTAAFAAMSWSTHQWIWITNPYAVGLIFQGPMGLAQATFKVMFAPNFVKNRLSKNDQDSVIIDRLITFLRSEMNKKLQQNEAAGGRL